MRITAIASLRVLIAVSFNNFDQTLQIFDMCFKRMGVVWVLFPINNLVKRQQMASLRFINPIKTKKK